MIGRKYGFFLPKRFMLNPPEKKGNADGGGNEPGKKTLSQFLAEDADAQSALDALIADRLKRDRETEERKRAANGEVEKKLVEMETRIEKMTSENTLAIEREKAARVKAEETAQAAQLKLSEIARANQDNLVKSEIKKALNAAGMKADLIDDYADVLFLRGKAKLDDKGNFVDVEFADKDRETLSKFVAGLAKDKPALIKATMGPGNGARGRMPITTGAEKTTEDKKAARAEFARNMTSIPKNQRGAWLEKHGLDWSDVGLVAPKVIAPRER